MSASYFELTEQCISDAEYILALNIRHTAPDRITKFFYQGVIYFYMNNFLEAIDVWELTEKLAILQQLQNPEIFVLRIYSTAFNLLRTYRKCKMESKEKRCKNRLKQYEDVFLDGGRINLSPNMKDLVLNIRKGEARFTELTELLEEDPDRAFLVLEEQRMEERSHVEDSLLHAARAQQTDALFALYKMEHAPTPEEFKKYSQTARDCASYTIDFYESNISDFSDPQKVLFVNDILSHKILVREACMRFERGEEKALEEAFIANDNAKGRVLLRYLDQDYPPKLDSGTLSLIFATYPNYVFVEYGFWKDELLIFVAQHSKIHLKKREAEEARIKMAVEDLNRTYYSLEGTGHSDEKLLLELYNLLIRPIRKFLSDKNSPIIFIPSAAIHDVPFSALLSNKNEDSSKLAPFGLATSLLGFWERSLRAEVIFPEKSLILGRTDMHTEVFGLRGVPELCNILGSNMLFENNDTRGKLVEMASSADIIHFFCHGYRLLRVGLNQSCMELHDCVMVPDILALKLKPNTIVVITACYGGYGDITSDGPYSLVRAFLAAGAAAVIGAPCVVYDPNIREISKYFYENLQSRILKMLESEQRIPLHCIVMEALHDSQMQLLKDLSKSSMSNQDQFNGTCFTKPQKQDSSVSEIQSVVDGKMEEQQKETEQKKGTSKEGALNSFYLYWAAVRVYIA